MTKRGKNRSREEKETQGDRGEMVIDQLFWSGEGFWPRVCLQGGWGVPFFGGEGLLYIDDRERERLWSAGNKEKKTRWWGLSSKDP